MRTMKAASLVLDFDLYIRNNVDSHNVTSIVDALAADHIMPPVIIDRRTRKVVDGFHRVRAHLKYGGDDADIAVIARNYRSDGDMLIDAARLNADHGAKLDTCDKMHIVLLAERLSVPLDAIAGALHMPVDKLGALRTTRTATDASSGLRVPLKRTVSRFHGQQLTPRQLEANTKLSGMSQVFYVNQLIELIESGMLNTGDDELITRLRHLHDLLDGVLAAKTL